MSYKELFSAIECNRIVIIEDDFKQGEYKKERALYDITRMAVDDRCRYLAEIESISQPLHEVLSKFLSLFDECFDKIGVWDDSIPYGDISSSGTLCLYSGLSFVSYGRRSSHRSICRKINRLYFYREKYGCPVAGSSVPGQNRGAQ